jgi:tetratricopeptide (TPR) repeat protein
MVLLAGFVVVFAVAGSRASVLARRQPAAKRASFKVTVLDESKTIKECDQFLTLNPSDTSSYVERAYADFKQGDRFRAIAHLNEAIRSNPHSAYLYSERANFRHKKLGDKHGAIEDYTKAIQLNPQNALFYFWRSQTYYALGDEQGAIKDYNQAIRLAPEETMYYCFQGSVK